MESRTSPDSGAAGRTTDQSPLVVDLIQDIKDEAIFKPAAEAVLHKRLAELGRDWPSRHQMCDHLFASATA
jgi:hypothetical protein